MVVAELIGGGCTVAVAAVLLWAGLEKLRVHREFLGTLTALTLRVRARKVKWKLAQNRDRATREKLIANLRRRARPADAAAADALQWALDHEAAKST